MAERDRMRKAARAQRERFEDRQAAHDETTPRSEETADGPELEELLDDIDELLDSNAENFVKSYVQKGGQ